MYPDDLFREFDRMFAELSLPMTSHARRGSFNPNADVQLTDGGRTVLVRVELAGVRSDHIKLVVEGATEIDYGYFLKKIQLPSPVAVETARAEYVDGMLTIILPIAAERRVGRVDRTEIRMVCRARA